jgi:photosystem II stability/assembly factor-like uncharacterized protein
MHRTIVLMAVLLAAATVTAGCGASGARPASKPLILTGLKLSPSPVLAPDAGSRIDVLGAAGLLLASADDGATWQTHALQQTLATDGFFWRVATADARHIWAIDRYRGEIVASADAGRTWTVQYRKAHVALTDVACSGPRHAWVVGFTAGGHPLILSTVDGGRTWITQKAPLDQIALAGVAFTDARHGWAVGRGSPVTGADLLYVLKTDDGGARWRVVYKGSNVGLGAIAATDARHCWVVGSSPHLDSRREYAAATIVVTSDGGVHWRTQLDGRYERLLCVTFADRLHGWAGGYRGTILATTDGGLDWAQTHVGPNVLVTAVACSGADRAWAVIPAMSTLLATRDGGASWATTRLCAPGRFGFWALSVPPAGGRTTR